MEEARDSPIEVIAKLLDAASQEEYLSIKEIFEKYELEKIGGATIGAVGSGTKLHHCPKDILEYIEKSNILTGFPIFTNINLLINLFSDTFGHMGKSWALNEALRSSWYVDSLNAYIKRCKEIMSKKGPSK
ncbi:MAG: hypothetical protein AB7F40_00320 [Victivallaceae bacterium]|nr:hypothetical protein [Victivallaceae bacterium]